MTRTALVLGRASNLLFAALLSLLLAACGSDDDNDTPPGNPPPDTTQNPSGLLSRTAAELNVTFDRVTIDGAPPVVDFTVRNEFGDGFVGLDIANLNFAIAKLNPATDGNPSYWQNYISNVVEPKAGALPGAQAQVQAGVDKKADGKLVDHGNGRYTYTFGTDITKVSAPAGYNLDLTYDPSLTHRLAIQISGTSPLTGEPVPVTNAVHTWQPSSGVTTGIATRDIVSVESCNSCHDKLAFHGGGRVDTKYCVMCHNPGSADPETGNTIDAKVLFHKLHRGASLPSVVAGGTYQIIGHNASVHDYSTLKFPQDIRNCTKCHDAANPATPDAGNWMTQINRATCGSCHDNVNFATGDGHPGGQQSDDSGCVNCHKEGGWAKSVAQAHTIPTKEPAAKFAYVIDDVTVDTDTTTDPANPVRTVNVKFSVVDPTDNNRKYNLQEDAWTQTGSALSAYFAWSNVGDYTGKGSVNVKKLVADGLTPNSDGSFTITYGGIPADATGSGSVAIYGAPVAALNPADPSVWTKLDVKSVVAPFAITDPVPVARREVVASAKCEGCHATLDGKKHAGSGRNEVKLCIICHNSEFASGSETRDFKRVIHGVHSTNRLAAKYQTLRFPGNLQNCETCHLPNTYTLPLKAGVSGSKVPEMKATNGGFDYVTPAAAVCSSCHATPAAISHMVNTGGAQYYNGGSTADPKTEVCEVCHGAGRVADVKVMHRIGK